MEECIVVSFYDGNLSYLTFASSLISSSLRSIVNFWTYLTSITCLFLWDELILSPPHFLLSFHLLRHIIGIIVPMTWISPVGRICICSEETPWFLQYTDFLPATWESVQLSWAIIWVHSSLWEQLRNQTIPERRLWQDLQLRPAYFDNPLFLEKLPNSACNMRWKAFSLYHS